MMHRNLVRHGLFAGLFSVLAAVELAQPSLLHAGWTTGSLYGVYRNAGDGNWWDMGGNVACTGDVAGPINFSWGGGASIGACTTNADEFQVEYHGQFNVSSSANWCLCVDTDDGGYVLAKIGGSWYSYVDDKTTHGQGTWRCGQGNTFGPGWNDVRVGFFEGGGGAGIKFGRGTWNGSSCTGIANIPAADLRTSSGYAYSRTTATQVTNICTSSEGFIQDGGDWMPAMYASSGDRSTTFGWYSFCDSECSFKINAQCGDCGSSWNHTDFSVDYVLPNKSEPYSSYELYEDDPCCNASDFIGSDRLAAANLPGDWTGGRWNNNSYAKMGDICPDNDGTEGGGSANCFIGYYRVYYDDSNAPDVPSAPSLADANAPTARAGYDNDLTLTVSWNETDDLNSGTGDYEIEIRQSADSTCTTGDTLLTTLTASDSDACTSTNNARTSTTAVTSGSYYCARVRARNGGCLDLVTGAPADQRLWSAWSALSSPVLVDVRHPVGVDAVPAGGFAPYTTYATGVLRCYARNRASGNENEQNMDGAVVGECNLAAPVSYDYGAGGVTCGAASGADNFNVDCWGEVLAGSTGVYSFGLNTDDGGYVMVNNTMVVRDQTYHGWNGANGAYTASGTISLTAGTWYPIRAGFFEAGGGASWELKWTPPAGALANIPAASLRRVNDHWARSADTISFDLIAHEVHSGPLMQNIVLAKSNAPTCGGWSWHDWSSTATNATNEGTCSTYITFPLSGSEIKEASESGGTTFVFRFTPDFLAASNGGDFDISTRNMDLAGDWSGDCTNTPSNDTCDVDTGRNLRIDDDAPTSGAVTPANTATATHVDGTFDLSTTFDDGTRSGMASCQQCKSTDGVCDTEWAAATWSAGTCSVSGLTCSDGQSLTLNMRATDNVGNTGTASGASRTCDTIAPTTTDNGSSAWSASDQTVTLTPADARSGVASTVYCVDTTNTCSPGTSGTSVSVTCAANNVCQQYVRYRSTDNVGNVQAIQTAASGATIKIDKQGPPTVPGSLAVMLTGNKTLKATWTAASDGTGSGLAATPYAVQIGLTGGDASGCAAVTSTASLSASPSQYRTAPAACTLTSMADNTQYCFIIRASDAVGNTSDSATVCATAVIANEDVAGVVKGFPTSATKADGTYIGTYTAANGNVVYLLNSSAVLSASETLGAAETIVGTTSWLNDGANAYAFVTTSQGKLYKLQNSSAGDPDGTPATDELTNPSGAGTAYFAVNSCGAGTSTLTSAPVTTAEAVWFAGKDTDCAVTERIYAVESKIDSAAGTNGAAVEMVRDAPGCSATSITSEPKVVVGAGPPYWPGTFAHIGSDCVNGANVKVYRIDADAGLNIAPDCAKDVLGSNISAWMTGGSGKLYFGTVGPSAVGRGFYVLSGTEDAACGTVYATVAGFPYQGPATDIGDTSRGAKPVFTSEQDEAYFVTGDGKLHCVCTKLTVDAAPPDTCTIAAADRCDGTPGVGQACVGFNLPITLESGVALGEPLFHDGTIYVVSNTGRVYAVEALCDTAADATASGTIKSANGYTYRLDTSGIESTLAVRCTSAAAGPCPSASTRLTLGTDTGRVFYLPVTP